MLVRLLTGRSSQPHVSGQGHRSSLGLQILRYGALEHLRTGFIYAGGGLPALSVAILRGSVWVCYVTRAPGVPETDWMQIKGRHRSGGASPKTSIWVLGRL